MSLALEEALSHDVYRTKRHLAALMKCPVRDVESAVEQARKAGKLPIMSGPDGYRLARNPDEYSLNVERRHKRALVQLTTVSGEKRLLEAWRNQIAPAPARPTQEALWDGVG